MPAETRQCQNCQKEFPIESDDLNFYEKVSVPPPTWCPECRLTRRLAFGNSWGIYFRNCDKCGKRVLTMYRPENPAKVFCDPCWWADDWDGTEYGVDYDPGRNFLDQWKELRMRTPHFAKDSLYLTLKNCEYTNGIAFSKNCYMAFWLDYCENVFYSFLLNTVKDSMDLLRANKSELCYDSVGLGQCSRTYFSNTCDNCVDTWFSRNCYGCMNCVGCVNLRNRSYMIFNRQYSHEEYLKKIKEFDFLSRKGLEKIRKEADEFWLSLPYREYTGNPKNLNVSGDYIFESKNAKSCYMCVGVEDSKYCQFVSVPKATNCMDYYGWGNSASLVYECATSGEGIQSVRFSYGMFGNGLDSEYCGWCIGAKSNFGCINLKRKQDAILNKVYPKEEYEKLRAKIIEDMDKNPYVDGRGRVYKYGEFFPPDFSLFPYLDSNAGKFVEKDKAQALAEGYNWQERVENNYKKTIKGNDLPDTIKDTEDGILNEVIECAACEGAYKITQGELDFYRKFDLPVPSRCPKCREAKRFTIVNKPKFYVRVCAKCGKSIQTAYAPDRPEIVYCEKCYQGEFL